MNCIIVFTEFLNFSISKELECACPGVDDIRLKTKRKIILNKAIAANPVSKTTNSASNIFL